MVYCPFDTSLKEKKHNAVLDVVLDLFISVISVISVVNMVVMIVVMIVVKIFVKVVGTIVVKMNPPFFTQDALLAPPKSGL